MPEGWIWQEAEPENGIPYSYWYHEDCDAEDLCYAGELRGYTLTCPNCGATVEFDEPDYEKDDY